jgi:hypothetical protein
MRARSEIRFDPTRPIARIWPKNCQTSPLFQTMVLGNEEFLLLNPEKRTTSRVLAPLTHHGSTSGLPHQQVQCWTGEKSAGSRRTLVLRYPIRRCEKYSCWHGANGRSAYVRLGRGLKLERLTLILPRGIVLLHLGGSGRLMSFHLAS